MRKRRTWPDSLVKDLEDPPYFQLINKDAPDFVAVLEAAVARAAEKNPRAGEMLLKYYRDGLTLREIGLEHGVTPERARQIVAKQRRDIRLPVMWLNLPRYVDWNSPWFREAYEKGRTT